MFIVECRNMFQKKRNTIYTTTVCGCIKRQTDCQHLSILIAEILFSNKDNHNNMLLDKWNHKAIVSLALTHVNVIIFVTGKVFYNAYQQLSIRRPPYVFTPIRTRSSVDLGLCLYSTFLLLFIKKLAKVPKWHI